MRKSLFPHILGHFSTINDFVIDLIAKKAELDTFFHPALTFSRNSTDSAFSFWLYSLKWKRRIRGNFKFWIISGDFCQIKRSDTILILETYNEYHLYVFCSKEGSFQDSSIIKFRYWTKSLLPHNLATLSKLNDFRIDLFAKKVVVLTFSYPELTFSRNSVDSTFSFWLYSWEWKRGIYKILDFQSIPEIFIKLKDLNTILILES